VRYYLDLDRILNKIVLCFTFILIILNNQFKMQSTCVKCQEKLKHDKDIILKCSICKDIAHFYCVGYSEQCRIILKIDSPVQTAKLLQASPQNQMLLKKMLVLQWKKSG